MNDFLWGALSMSAWIAGLFFLRFWHITRDRLFAFMSVAFCMLSLNWLCLALLEVAVESRHQVYVIRLLAFVLIVIGVVDKNRRAAQRDRSSQRN
jgi:hypothetical protein